MKKDAVITWEEGKLFYKGINTHITIRRSTEGYSHFQKLEVTDMGKVKGVFSTKEESEARAFAESHFWKEVADTLLAQKE